MGTLIDGMTSPGTNTVASLRLMLADTLLDKTPNSRFMMNQIWKKRRNTMALTRKKKPLRLVVMMMRHPGVTFWSENLLETL